MAEGQAAYAQGDFAAALRELDAPGARGDLQAQLLRGLLYLDGLGVPKDEAAGLKLVRDAAEGGNASAQFVLGRLHEAGRGVPKNEAQAARWYRSAAEQGHARAQALLGLLLSQGRGGPQDDAQAVTWWQRAAAAGDVDSQRWLGVAYADGSGIERSAEQAYFWLLVAAARGGEGPLRYQLHRDRAERALAPDRKAAMQDAARDWRPQGDTRAFVLDFERRTGAAATGPATTPGPATVARLPAGAAPPTARLLQRISGSGIVVSVDRVVTSRHVVLGCNRVTVAGQDVDQAVANDAASDLALLAWRTPTGSPAPLRAVPAQIGEPAVAAGFPLSNVLSGMNVTIGNVSGHAQLKGLSRLVQFTAPIQPGSSGGPLLDAAGSVVGVVVGKLDIARGAGNAPQNVNFAIGADALSAFLEAQRVPFVRAPQAAAAVTTQEIARRAAGFTVAIECWK